MELEERLLKEGARQPPVADDPEPGDDPEVRKEPEEDSDLAPPELVNLMFAVGLKDDKAPTVLEAIQDVVLYCQSLNIPVLRFHSDRGMEFQARASKQWLKNQGIRVTSSEAGAHQTNGAAESTVRWVKQRARTLLLSAKLPQQLWPMAVTTAATMQRSNVLGFETTLAAPFGAKVMVRKRQMEGPKLDDLAPKWIQGFYVGRSESLRKGHLVYIKDDEGERFVHTLHVRSALYDPGPVEEELVSEEPAGPSKRLRGKSSGSGDVVAVSKATVFDEMAYQTRAEAVLEQWSQEEAEAIVTEIAWMLPSTENIYGMFRHGGKTGITRATIERPWFAKILLKLMLDKAPDAEFAAIFVSVNNEREVHIDRNNAMGTLNYLLPIVMPRKGGDIWQELRNGDVVQGRVSELETPEGRKSYGCSYPLQVGHVFQLNPHRRHAVLPWKGERLVLVGYTPGMLQNLAAPDRERLWTLGFPMPLFDELTGTVVNINALSVRGIKSNIYVDDDGDRQVEQCTLANESLRDAARQAGMHATSSTSTSPVGDLKGAVRREEWEQWEMRIVLGEVGIEASVLSEAGFEQPCLRKAEVVFTENVEEILSQLQVPLSVVYTVNPREVALNFEVWIPPLKREILTISHAVEKAKIDDEGVQQEVSSGVAQLIPMKIVYTVKPPDTPPPGEEYGALYKRKCRIVICGNLASHQPGDVYTNTAPAEVVRAALAIARKYDWNLGIVDVIAAFLQTPFAELADAPLVYGVPPKILVRAGLCQSGEIWKLTHAVYGLQESPRLWGQYRDVQLARIQIIYEGKRVTLRQGRVEPSWWSVLQEGSVLIGIIVVYVDDILICGHTEIIRELAGAIRAVWKTNDLQLVSDGTIRFLGIEISLCSQGFSLSQRSYIEELVRLHQMPATRKDIIPVSKDLASFTAEAEEGVYSDAELKLAQQCAGELLWVSQRTRPDLSFVASLVGSLATKAPRRATQVGEKAIAFLQRTVDYTLIFESEEAGLVGFCDASFAPDGARSHGGWVVMYNGCLVSWKSSRQSTVTLSTAESELTAIAEAMLALQSVSSMLQDVVPRTEPMQLYTDSTSALTIANGSGSWRTRHLRLKSAWITELLSSEDVKIAHCAGEWQIADLLTKALPSHRIKTLSNLLNLRGPDEDKDDSDVKQAIPTSNCRSSSARAPNQCPKLLIALLVLSQATVGESYSWSEEEAIVVQTGMSVDYGVVTWAILWGAVILALLAWELLKWVLWIAYDRATPGSRSRRLRRLQKLRDATTSAIQREIEVRRGGKLEQRGRDAGKVPAEQLCNPPRQLAPSAASSSGMPESARKEGRDEERIQLLRRLAKGVKETCDASVQAGVFTPQTIPDTRVILRYVHEPPGETFYLPGNECYHVYGDCHAFRHRGTADRVERRRLCQYCLNRADEDPDKRANYGEDLARAQEYERMFNTQLRTSGQPVPR